jgi:cyclic beta-1,2-glucan synthetase
MHAVRWAFRDAELEAPRRLQRTNVEPALVPALAAQRYLRSCGVRLDLVLVDEQASGYAGDASGTLRRVLAQHDHDWIGRHGGIHVLAADQSSEEERRLLEAAARVVLDTRDGSLAARLSRVVEVRAKLPRFDPTLANGTTFPFPPPPRPKLTFDNGMGRFTGRAGLCSKASRVPAESPIFFERLASSCS